LQQFVQSRGVARAAGGSCHSADALGKEPRKAFALPGEEGGGSLFAELLLQPTFLGSVDVGA